MQVTRHFSPLERNLNTSDPVSLVPKIASFLSFCESRNRQDKHKPGPVAHSTQPLSAGALWDHGPSFCDWVSIYQTHGQGLPLVNDGAFVRYDADGSHVCTTLRKSQVEGSHSTSCQVRCDGETVWFDGNVSRFGRPDNVFGFTFAQCVDRINAILRSMGLPAFTTGDRLRVSVAGGQDDKPHWTGARVTRLDLTQNFSAGSQEDAHHFMRFLATQQASRLKTGTHGEGDTVDFGRGSRRVYSKAYLKGPEILRHIAKSSDPIYSAKLASWCNSVGLVRFETTYKSTWLIDNQLQYLGAIKMSQFVKDFENRQEVFTRATLDVDELSSLPKETLAVYRMWQAGDDIASKYKKSQFYKYRSALLPYGVDIAVRNNVVQFQPKTRVIKLGPVQMPDFYELPNASFVRLAA